MNSWDFDVNNPRHVEIILEANSNVNMHDKNFQNMNRYIDHLEMVLRILQRNAEEANTSNYISEMLAMKDSIYETDKE